MKIGRYMTLCFIPVFTTVVALSFSQKKATHQPVKSTLFDCPVLDAQNMVIIPSDCNGSNGSIVGMQGSGTGNLKYTWYDINNKVVGSSADLTAVPSGQYRVVLTDDAKCTQQVTASYYVPEKNAVKIDYVSAIITSPGCNQANGSITGINITGATKYQWTDNNNKIVGTGKDLLNAPLGFYVLTASNTSGCMAQARYNLPPGSSAPFLTAYSVTGSDCKATGSFHATFDMKSTDPSYLYSIADLKGKEYFSGGIAYTPGDSTRILLDPPFNGIPAGTYTLTTVGGTCVTNLLTFKIPQDTFRVDTSMMVIHTDICGQNLGTITYLLLKGGPGPSVPSPPGHGYFWFDSTGKRLSAQKFLAGYPAGKYTFYVINDDGCKTPTLTFTIPDSISTASKPSVKDVNLCLPGPATMKVANLDRNATYHLYDSNLKLVSSNRTGLFIPSVKYSTVFYIGAKDGICESPLAKVKVTIAIPGVVIPNTFTPNHDGINDTWNVTGLANFPGTEVSVFNRTGTVIYHSINYTQPFDGTYKGSDLEAGVYYYVIAVPNAQCKNSLSGSLTILR